ncbi:MAG: DUF1844 domain-containing protein [Actinomycetes bacterium]
MTPPSPNRTSPDPASSGADGDPRTALRDIGQVPAVEVVTTVALHLMSAAAVQLGLGDPQDAGPGEPTAHQPIDLDEARTLITSLAGLITASAPRLGTFHAAPLRDGLRTLQLAFREASPIPDAPGRAPGEDLTGPVLP